MGCMVWHCDNDVNPCLLCSELFAPCGRSCMASITAARESDMRKRRARLAGAAEPGPAGHSSAALPAAALAAEAARAAAQTTAHGQVIQDNTRVFQRARAIGDAAIMLARSAEQRETAPGRSPAERARSTSSAAAASRSRCRTAADNVTDTSGSTSGSSYAPSAAVGAPEPGGAAGFGPRAGGPAILLPCGAVGPPPVLEGSKCGL